MKRKSQEWLTTTWCFQLACVRNKAEERETQGDPTPCTCQEVDPGLARDLRNDTSSGVFHISNFNSRINIP